MVKETIALWKYAIELSKTIQESSYTIVKIDIDEFGTEIECMVYKFFGILIMQ